MNRIPQLHFGRLLDVFGHTAEFNGMRIIPAKVELQGSMFLLEFALAQYSPTFPPVLRTPIYGGYDAAWVVARIPYVLGFSPEPSKSDKSLLDLGFIAVMPNLNDAFPFKCSDYYGKTSLIFSPDGPRAETKSQIADAYWSTLLADPEELSDFSTRVRHLGAGVDLEFGCQSGEPFCFEHREEPEESD